MFNNETMLDYKAFNIYWEKNKNGRSRCNLQTFIKYKEFYNKYYLEANNIIRKQKLEKLNENN